MTIWTPRPDQLPPLDFVLRRDSAGLFMTPGYGKTALSLATFKALHGRGLAKRALVICPLRPMVQVWPKEIAKWDDFNDIKPVILHGAHKDAALKSGGDLFLINPEGLPWLFDQPARLRQFDMLVVDESTKFKNSQSGRFKLLRNHVDTFKYRYILSGTPRPRSLENLFPQLFLLDSGHRLGAYITHFRRRYMFDAAPKHANYSDWHPAPGAEDEVYKRISDICMTLTDEDYAGAPPFIENQILVDLPAAARQQYNEMKAYTRTEIAGNLIRPKNAGGRTMKLRQMASGFVYDDGIGHFVHAAKIDALVDLIDELDGRPLLVAVEFRHEYAAIHRALHDRCGIDAPYFGSGGVAARDTQSVIDRWNSGACPVIIANPMSAGHGIDGLQDSGSDCCFFTLTPDFETFDQLRRRLKRTGQLRPTTVHYIEAAGTLDQNIRELVVRKQDKQVEFFNALRLHTNDTQRSNTSMIANDTPDTPDAVVDAPATKPKRVRKPKADAAPATEIVVDKPKRVQKPKADAEPTKAARAPEKGDPSYLPPTHPINVAIKRVPSPRALSKFLGLTAQAMYSLRVSCAQGKPMRAEYVLKIAALSDKKPYAMRPDLYLREWSVPQHTLTDDGSKKALPKE